MAYTLEVVLDETCDLPGFVSRTVIGWINTWLRYNNRVYLLPFLLVSIGLNLIVMFAPALIAIPVLVVLMLIGAAVAVTELANRNVRQVIFLVVWVAVL